MFALVSAREHYLVMTDAHITRPEDLYALPLEEFTAARDGFVKALREQGDEELAGAVKAMRKPSLPAWAVNQLARGEGEDVRRLFQLRDDIAAADDAAGLRSLTSERRRIMAGLLARAEELLAAAGHSATATTTDAIAKTLQAGGSDDERRRIEEGTLERPLTPTGVEGLDGFAALGAVSDDVSPEPAPNAAARAAAEQLAGAAQAAEAEANELTSAAEAAAREAEELARRAERARRRAESARKKADEALDDLGT